jgi:multicomponent Na+:H+ antiporter subunit E
MAVPKRVRSVAGLVRAALLLALWLVLTGPDPGGLVFGLFAVTGATALSLRLLAPAPGRAPWRALPMLPGFVWRSLLGGLDVARRAVDPRMPLAPGWTSVPCRLSPGGRFLIGAEFSLMPGTLIAGCRGGEYLVHLLDARQPARHLIEAEENRLGHALGEGPHGETGLERP